MERVRLHRVPHGRYLAARRLLPLMTVRPRNRVLPVMFREWAEWVDGLTPNQVQSDTRTDASSHRSGSGRRLTIQALDR